MRAARAGCGSGGVRAARAGCGSGGVRAARADGGSGGCEPHGLMMGGMGMVGAVRGVGAVGEVGEVGGVKKEKLCQSFGTLTKFIGFLLHGWRDSNPHQRFWRPLFYP